MTLPDWMYRQSAVIPFRVDKKGRLSILLITSRRKRRWIIPKGVVEPDMSSHDSAAKEAHEEAGVLGKVSKKLLGTYSYEKWGGVCKVEVFSMAVNSVLDQWEEDDRDREWFTPDEAIERIQERKLQKIITAFASSFD